MDACPVRSQTMHNNVQRPISPHLPAARQEGTLGPELSGNVDVEKGDDHLLSTYGPWMLVKRGQRRSSGPIHNSKKPPNVHGGAHISSYNPVHNWHKDEGSGSKVKPGLMQQVDGSSFMPRGGKYEEVDTLPLDS